MIYWFTKIRSFFLHSQLNDLDKIRESCELFSSQFPLAPEIWTKWLQIEVSIATGEAELKRVHGLLKRALGDYFCKYYNFKIINFPLLTHASVLMILFYKKNTVFVVVHLFTSVIYILAVSVGGLHCQLAIKVSNPQEIWDEIIPTYALDCMEGSTFFKDWRSYYTKHVPE